MLTVHKTAVNVTAMILEHSLGSRFVTIYWCSCNPAITTVPTDGVMYVKFSFFNFVLQPISRALAGVRFRIEGLLVGRLWSFNYFAGQLTAVSLLYNELRGVVD